MPYGLRLQYERTLKEICKHLNTYDSIVRAITSKNFKEVLTVEHGNFFYWVRLYRNGDNDFRDSARFENTLEGLNKAVEYFNKRIQELKQENINLLYHKL